MQCLCFVFNGCEGYVWWQDHFVYVILVDLFLIYQALREYMYLYVYLSLYLEENIEVYK